MSDEKKPTEIVLEINAVDRERLLEAARQTCALSNSLSAKLSAIEKVSELSRLTDHMRMMEENSAAKRLADSMRLLEETSGIRQYQKQMRWLHESAPMRQLAEQMRLMREDSPMREFAVRMLEDNSALKRITVSVRGTPCLTRGYSV